MGTASVKYHAHHDFRLLHYTLSILFQIGQSPAPILRNQHIIEKKLHSIDVEFFNTGVADGGQDATKIGVGCKKKPS